MIMIATFPNPQTVVCLFVPISNTLESAYDPTKPYAAPTQPRRHHLGARADPGAGARPWGSSLPCRCRGLGFLLVIRRS